ncbi:MAG: TRAP transporter large permease [Acidiferrobacteraceae bacterium]|jgi:tripartite ATP-independent transporter DctM subunit|nr:TRAP transporter large permease [Acidiferrobacteraceae bacterium]MBT3640106.1 TRAP transporter large permease [Acidiferrobacteraceae bacterium]MBT3769956.1 TRAP transporter large permease [Acidiferrobacteraceae bacterium]MBT3974657.1 TRAP transporter large permease [Acidiferrobacteraceae bacterium]MBT4395603.1 TRAP transporter large permease [Acidiferrobacteraceae bacterium]
MLESLYAFLAMLALVLLARIPIAFAMGLVGFVGFSLVTSWNASLAMATIITYETAINYGLSVVPLFILMGNFVTRAGLSDELYTAAHAFLGHRRGGLAMATIVACGGFSAVCGSSLATAATMSKVALPPMRRFGYSDALATGSVAAGGTLGILIPPSVILIILGIMTQSDIGLLFIAGILPGLLGVLLYLVAVLITVTIDPTAGPRGPRADWHQRWHAVRGVSAVLALFVLVIGGIYAGMFTPTEAAGIGASGAFMIALLRRKLSWPSLFETLLESARTTAMIFVILIGALIFSNFINIVGLPDLLLSWVTSFNLPPIAVILLIMLVYVILGTVLESLSMIMLTVPVFYPLVLGMELGGFSDALADPEMALIWFGIIVVVITEISLITPPVGLNVFVLKSMLKDVSLGTIFRGVTPFWIVDIVRLLILMLIPSIVLLLPSLMN